MSWGLFLWGWQFKHPHSPSQYAWRSFCCFLWVGNGGISFPWWSVSVLSYFSAENMNCFCNKREMTKDLKSHCQFPSRVKRRMSLCWSCEGSSRESKLSPRWRVLGICVLESLGLWRRQSALLLQLWTVTTAKNGMSWKCEQNTWMLLGAHKRNSQQYYNRLGVITPHLTPASPPA